MLILFDHNQYSAVVIYPYILQTIFGNNTPTEIMKLAQT